VFWRISDVVTAMSGRVVAAGCRTAGIAETDTREGSAENAFGNLDIWTKMRVGNSTRRTAVDREANRGSPIRDRRSVVRARPGA
jgi:hypothetical protein